MRILQLEGRRVALWGWGREGRAAYRAIRARLPGLPLTLFGSLEEAADARALGDAALAIETDASTGRLSAFDVVVKSPGISPYRAEAIAAAAQGTRFIGGTTLWFAERSDARAICVTGTKGKSTTTALLAHLLRASGHRTALCGNIGLPLLELLDDDAAFWAIELSSYQTRDVAAGGVRPHIAIVTNVFPEHL
ncbi:MAG: Mur ligase family protein, partial [Luteimonas sp.]